MAPYVKVLSTDGKFHGPISAAVTLEQVARWLRLPGTISLRSLVLREPGEDPEVIEDPDFLVPPGVYEVVRGDCSDDPGVGRGRKKKTKAEEVRLQARIRREVSQFERKSAQPTRPHEEAGGGGGEEATRRAAVVSAETPNLGEREVRRKLEDALRAVYQQVALKTEAALSGSSAGPDDLTPLLREVEYCFLDLVDLIEEAACIAGPGSRPLVEHITSESVRRTLKFLYIKLVEIHRMLETASCTVLDEGSKDPSGKKVKQPDSTSTLQTTHRPGHRLPNPWRIDKIDHKKQSSVEGLNFASFLNMLTSWRDDYLSREPTRYNHPTDYMNPEAQKRGAHFADRVHSIRRVIAITTSSRERRKSPVHSHRVQPVYLFRHVAAPSAFPPVRDPSFGTYHLDTGHCLREARKRFVDAMVATGSHRDEELTALINVVTDLEAAAARRRCHRDVVYPSQEIKYHLRREFNVKCIPKTSVAAE